ncbi:uncharacterized protein RJT20DRAFT_45293 [Scheffersomyces xylosifermentans]|uniref:uncharacterized protein n=1 Tax=Scheffersomyces xylosifermentans TaxID=1304137 RepID=UPI00315DFBDB
MKRRACCAKNWFSIFCEKQLRSQDASSRITILGGSNFDVVAKNIQYELEDYLSRAYGRRYETPQRNLLATLHTSLRTRNTLPTTLSTAVPSIIPTSPFQPAMSPPIAHHIVAFFSLPLSHLNCAPLAPPQSGACELRLRKQSASSGTYLSHVIEGKPYVKCALFSLEWSQSIVSYSQINPEYPYHCSFPLCSPAPITSTDLLPFKVHHLRLSRLRNH